MRNVLVISAWHAQSFTKCFRKCKIKHAVVLSRFVRVCSTSPCVPAQPVCFNRRGGRLRVFAIDPVVPLVVCSVQFVFNPLLRAALLRVLHDFAAEDNGQLKLKLGETVETEGIPEDDWIFGR